MANIMEKKLDHAEDRLTQLPTELVFMIASHLDKIGLARLTRTCKEFYHILLAQLYKIDIENGDCHAMWWACVNGNVATIEAAIKHGEPVDRRFESHRERLHDNKRLNKTPLIVAIHAQKHAAVKCLTSYGADVYLPDLESILALPNRFPINCAMETEFMTNPEAIDNRHDILATLLQAGADANQLPIVHDWYGTHEPQDGGAPICVAMRHDFPPKSVQLLLDYGANQLKPSSIICQQYLDISAGRMVRGNAMEILFQLRSPWLEGDGPEKFWILYNHAGGRLSISIPKLLTYSTIRPTEKKLNILKRLHELGQLSVHDVNARVHDSGNALETLLMYVGQVVMDRPWYGQFLLVTGRTYVQVLVDFVNFFLDIGAQFQSSLGSQIVSYYGSQKDNALDVVVDLLLRRCSFPHYAFRYYTDVTGGTALHRSLDGRGVAADYDVFGRVKMLLGYGFDARARNDAGATPILLACIYWPFADCIRLVEILLQHGADANARDYDGYTPLQMLLNHNKKITDPEEVAVITSLLVNAGTSLALRRQGRP